MVISAGDSVHTDEGWYAYPVGDQSYTDAEFAIGYIVEYSPQEGSQESDSNFEISHDVTENPSGSEKITINFSSPLDLTDSI